MTITFNVKEFMVFFEFYKVLTKLRKLGYNFKKCLKHMIKEKNNECKRILGCN